MLGGEYREARGYPGREEFVVLTVLYLRGAFYRARGEEGYQRWVSVAWDTFVSTRNSVW